MTPTSLVARASRPAARALLIAFLAAATVLLSAGSSFADTTYKLTLKISGLDSPLYVSATPGDSHRYFIVLRAGVITIVDDWTR